MKAWHMFSLVTVPVKTRARMRKLESFIVILICLCVKGSRVSEKKGYSFSTRYTNCKDFLAFTNISWWYDWSDKPFYHADHTCGNMYGISRNHVPMVWGWNSHHHFSLTLPNHTLALLGFNEPNHKQQSSLTPEIAASHWPEIERRAHGVPLVSPAASGCGVPAHCLGNTMEWFDAFFKACNSCRVDYLATHLYSCNPAHTMSVLRNLYNRYHRKIWLTEFSCQHTHDANKQLHYMKAILPLLEAADYIHRYSWFIARYLGGTFVTESANLLQSNSSKLTALGKYYNDFPNVNHGASSIVG